MPKAPFAIDPNSAGNVSNVNLRGDFGGVPQANVVAEVGNLLTTAAAGATELHKTQLTSEVKGDIKAVELALQASRYPSLKESIFSKEALANPVVKNALGEFTKIQDAVRVGRLPSEYAVDRYNDILQTAVSRSPEFAQELRGAARDAIGFDPHAKFMQNLLQQTPEQQAYQQLRKEAAANGFTVEQQIALNQQGAVMQNQLVHYQLLKQQGQYSTSLLAKEANTRLTLTTGIIIQEAQKQIQQGGIRNPELLNSQIDAAFANETAALVNQLPAGTDPATVNAQISLLNSRRDMYKDMVTNGDLSTILTKHNKLLTEEAVASFAENFPTYFNIRSIAGQEVLMTVMGKAEQFRNNPEAWDNYVKNTREGAELAGALSVAQAMERGTQIVYDQVPATSEQDKKYGALVAATMLQTQGLDTKNYAMAIDKLNALTDEEVTWNTLGDRNIATNVARNKDVQGAVINIFRTEAGALTSEFMRLRETGLLPAGGLKLENGKIVVTNEALRPGASTQTPGGRSVTAFTGDIAGAQVQDVRAFADRFNRAVDIAGRYQRLGVFNESVFKDGNTLFEGIVQLSGKPEQLPPAEPEVQVWDFDDKGGLIRIK